MYSVTTLRALWRSGTVTGESSHRTNVCIRGRPNIGAVLTQPQPEPTLCTVTGLIDAGTIETLRNALAQACHDHNPHLVIDLSPITSMNSTGLYALLEARHKHAIAGGGHLAVVVRSNPVPIPELYLVGLEAAFDVHRDVTGALHACASVPTVT
ncbi:MAG: STAS domain-containing protein [Pseudonocardiaceae bacterium]